MQTVEVRLTQEIAALKEQHKLPQLNDVRPVEGKRGEYVVNFKSPVSQKHVDLLKTVEGVMVTLYQFGQVWVTVPESWLTTNEPPRYAWTQLGENMGRVVNAIRQIMDERLDLPGRHEVEFSYPPDIPQWIDPNETVTITFKFTNREEVPPTVITQPIKLKPVDMEDTAKREGLAKMFGDRYVEIINFEPVYTAGQKVKRIEDQALGLVKGYLGTQVEVEFYDGKGGDDISHSDYPIYIRRMNEDELVAVEPSYAERIAPVAVVDVAQVVADVQNTPLPTKPAKPVEQRIREAFAGAHMGKAERVEPYPEGATNTDLYMVVTVKPLPEKPLTNIHALMVETRVHERCVVVRVPAEWLPATVVEPESSVAAADSPAFSIENSIRLALEAAEVCRSADIFRITCVDEARNEYRVTAHVALNKDARAALERVGFDRVLFTGERTVCFYLPSAWEYTPSAPDTNDTQELPAVALDAQAASLKALHDELAALKAENAALKAETERRQAQVKALQADYAAADQERDQLRTKDARLSSPAWTFITTQEYNNLLDALSAVTLERDAMQRQLEQYAKIAAQQKAMLTTFVTQDERDLTSKALVFDLTLNGGRGGMSLVKLDDARREGWTVAAEHIVPPSAEGKNAYYVIRLERRDAPETRKQNAFDKAIESLDLTGLDDGINPLDAELQPELDAAYAAGAAFVAHFQSPPAPAPLLPVLAQAVTRD